ATLSETVATLKEQGVIPAAVDIKLEGSAGKLKDIKEALLGKGTLSSVVSSSLFMAAASIYLLMCVLFQSWKQPFIIMFSVPLATFGGFIGLAVIHAASIKDQYMPVQNLDVLTILGFVILAGVVVNNAILIVAQTNNLMKGVDDSGNTIDVLPVRQAVAEAVQSRFRPIMMSMLTSVGGMLPLVINPGSGSELYRGLGAVIVGGMLFSTFFTLILVPVMLSLSLDVFSFSARKSRIVTQVATAGLILLMSSCSTAMPEVNLTEKVEIPASWKAATALDEDTSQQWWKNFEDEQLTALILRAREKNLDIVVTLEKLKRFQAQTGVAKSHLLPRVNGVGSYNRSRFSENLKENFRSAEGVSTWSGAFAATWEIDFFARLRQGLNAAQMDVLSVSENLKYLHVVIDSEVADNYLLYRSLQERFALIEKQQKLHKDNLDFIKARHKAGTSTELDIADAQIVLANTQAESSNLKSDLLQRLNALSLLVGEVPGSLIKELGGFRPLPNFTTQAQLGLPANLLRRRPDIRAAEALVIAEAARLKVAEKEYLPKFHFNGDIGLNSSFLSKFVDSGSHRYSFGPSFEWRLLSAGQIKSEIEVQQAKLQENVEVYRKKVLT
ncbi:MAG: efflux RND transporter permease subunit, partial [Lentisphaeraceae bacterium]|nr:efflux RND transporter permease subunit [Lentisphaeraceae bacterium]